MCSVVGNGIFRLFRVVDQALKSQNMSLAKRDAANYTCHAWAPEGEKDRLIVCTEAGEVMVHEQGELKQNFNVSGGEGKGVTALAVHGKGFVCGGGAGYVWLFERQDQDKEPFKLVKTLIVPFEEGHISSISISPSEDHAALTTSTGQAYNMSIANAEMIKSEEANFDTLVSSFHESAITGLDTCIRKPLILTCSTDKTVRMWNYQERTCELSKKFIVEPSAVALHPTGLMALVGFEDKLRLMTALMDDLRVVKELAIKGCRVCRFSDGGQFFAAVNGSTIHIYNTYTGQNIGNLRGHNGKVASVKWAGDDRKLISTGADGAVYEWSLKEFKRVGENVMKGVNYLDLVSTPDCQRIWAVGSDRKIKELHEEIGVDGKPTGSTIIHKELEFDDVPTQITYPTSETIFGKDALVLAMSSGVVKSLKLPLAAAPAAAEGDGTSTAANDGGSTTAAAPSGGVELKAHSTAVTCLCFTPDHGLLLTADASGTLCVSEVESVKEGADAGKTAAAAAAGGGGGGGASSDTKLAWSDEVLVTRADLEERKAFVMDLQSRKNDDKLHFEYQLRMKDMAMTEEIKKLTSKFTEEMEHDKDNFERLLQEKNEMEMEYEEKLKQAEEQRVQQLQAVDAQFQQKIMVEVERYQQLQAEKDLLNERWEEQFNTQSIEHEKMVREMTEEFEAKIQEEQMNCDRLQQEKEDNSKEFEEIRRQMEEDTDREIEALKDQYEKALHDEHTGFLNLKGESTLMKRNFNVLHKDIEEKREEIRQLFEKEKDLYATITSLERDIVGLKKEIRERDETIGDKEKRIYDLKKKNQELEKFKFVLDYKIRELKKQIEPREQEITKMREQAREMDYELERYHKQNNQLDLAIQELKLRVGALQDEVLLQRTRYHDSRNYVKRFRHDLHECVQFIQEPKLLKEKIKWLYQAHVSAGELEEIEVDTEVESEHERQRTYLEGTVETLKKKLGKESRKAKQDNHRIMQENVALIKEINELRREIKALRLNATAGMASMSMGASSQRDLTHASGRMSVPPGTLPRGGGGAANNMPGGAMMTTTSSRPGTAQAEMAKDLALQADVIASLRREMDDKDQELEQLRSLTHTLVQGGQMTAGVPTPPMSAVGGQGGGGGASPPDSFAIPDAPEAPAGEEEDPGAATDEEEEE